MILRMVSVSVSPNERKGRLDKLRRRRRQSLAVAVDVKTLTYERLRVLLDAAHVVLSLTHSTIIKDSDFQ